MCHTSPPPSLPPAELPDMAADDRVVLIQERIRELQRRWAELKTEVAYHDRRRRRAKRKEREGESRGKGREGGGSLAST